MMFCAAAGAAAPSSALSETARPIAAPSTRLIKSAVLLYARPPGRTRTSQKLRKGALRSDPEDGPRNGVVAREEERWTCLAPIILLPADPARPDRHKTAIFGPDFGGSGRYARSWRPARF